MFEHLGWPERVRKPEGRRFKPRLETLEDRTVLSVGNGVAPVLSYNVSIVTGRMLNVSGTVVDQRPDTSTVTFTGIINYSVTPDANGSFSFVTEASAAGFINASVLDDEGLTTLGDPVYVEGAYGDIVDIEVIEGENPGEITVTGRFVGEFAPGTAVHFEGAGFGMTFLSPSLNFSWSTMEVKPGDLKIWGIDIWGRQTQKTIWIRNRPPKIISAGFRAVPGGFYEFYGKAIDEDLPDVTVRFSGIPALEGKTARTDSEGNFKVVVTIGPNDNGLVTLIARDKWNADSDPKRFFFFPV